MIQFEDRLRESAKRLSARENQTLHVPTNPIAQKQSYWGWMATPAAAVVGIVLGMSMDLLTGSDPEIRYVQATDTICIERPIHDTLYTTQVVEKVKVITRPVEVPLQVTERNKHVAEEEDTASCTSVQCDGINYAVLALN